jgi:hypothetical protein
VDLRLLRRTRHSHETAKGKLLLDDTIKAMQPLVDQFLEEADTPEALDEADRVIDLLFAFTVILRGADAQAWARFGTFTIMEGIPRRDDQAAALRDIQLSGTPELRARQVQAANWARSDLTSYIQTLPDEWFIFQLPDGRRTKASGVKENCVEQLAFRVVALTNFDDASEDHLRVLYTPVQVIVPIEDVLGLAAK